MTIRFVSRRRVLKLAGALAAGTIVAACSTTTSSTGPTFPTRGPLIGPTVLPTAVSSPVKGKLLVVLDGNFQAFDLGTLSAQPITTFPKGAYAASPRLAFDRKSIAYTYYVVPKDPKDLGGSDLYVMSADGSNARMIHVHPESGATYEDPCFSADGKFILATLRKPVYDSQGQFQGETLAIQRVGIDGSQPTQVVTNALGPAASPDGKYLMYTAVDDKGQPVGFRVADAQGANGKDPLANQSFAYVRFPSFSPDGSQIVFSAVGGPGAAAPQQKIFGASLFSIAEAHGIPWEIWTVRPDGSELKRLTHESEDTPVPAWSPKGDWIAFAGEIGLYLVDAAGAQTTRISTLVSGGGIVWLS
jgi:Tol biopolymer transport system component